MKDYPLEIINCGSDDYILMSKGHHDFDEFMEKVRSEEYEWPLGMPKHLWVKATPDNSGEFDCIYSYVDRSVRGSFPATVTFEEYGEDRYELIRDARLELINQGQG